MKTCFHAILSISENRANQTAQCTTAKYKFKRLNSVANKKYTKSVFLQIYLGNVQVYLRILMAVYC